METAVRTNIEIDDDLMQQAMKASGLATKRETIEAGLHLLVQLKRQQGIRSYRGRLHWEGNLERMRRDA
jgi:Arc/MetJ family transcription regulator